MFVCILSYQNFTERDIANIFDWFASQFFHAIHAKTTKKENQLKLMIIFGFYLFLILVI